MTRKIFISLIAFVSVALPVKSQTAWEKDIRQFEKLDSAETYSPNAVLFAGSSSIRLWSTIKRDMAPYEIIQRGFGGSKLSDLVVYADRIIAPHPCSAVVLFVANDITGSADDKTPQQVADLFSQVLQIIRKSHPKTPVFWIEITPTPSRWKVWDKATEANQIIKNMCDKKNNTYYIATSQAFIGKDRLPVKDYFMPDMLHLNEQGYKIWSGVIKKRLGEVVHP
ncbi:MAG TPA: GDSL-type esterase/lipase family protein [Bacteroidales bacterium]|nr:GDSL-type esterase/lipase family protein [Bacteroidales bacterium]